MEAHGSRGNEAQGSLGKMRTFLAALLIVAGASCAVVTALTLDDQPIGGVSEPSRWATVITPDPTYKPLLCAPELGRSASCMLPVLFGASQKHSRPLLLTFVALRTVRRCPLPTYCHRPANLGVLCAVHRRSPLPENTLTAQHLPSYWDWCGRSPVARKDPRLCWGCT